MIPLKNIKKFGLIVEVDDSVSKSLAEFIRMECSIVPLCSSTVAHSIKMMRFFKIQLIMVDLVLDHELGIQVIEMAREIYPKKTPRIILMSTNPKASIIAQQLKVDYFLKKPFDVNELIEQVDFICENK